MMAVGRRAAHLVSYRIARKVNDPKYVGILLKKPIDPVFQDWGSDALSFGRLLGDAQEREQWRNRLAPFIIFVSHCFFLLFCV